MTALLCMAAPASAGKDAFNSTGLRKAVTLAGVREHQAALQAIANMNGGRRTSGTPGYDASADYVASRLQDAGYAVTRQTFPFDFFEDLAPPVFQQISPTPTTYQTPEQFTTMTYSGSGDVTAAARHVTQVGALGPGCTSADFAGFPAGNIALIRRGGCTFKTKAINAQTAGASAVVIYNNVDGPLNGTLGSVGQNIPVIGTLQSIGTAIANGGPAVLHIAATTRSETRQTENVLADLPGGDAGRTVVVGAHLDSVAQGPGINDNGSGTATDLEIAEQLAARDYEPRNKLRFAFWGAEEFNLVGSTYYVSQLSEDELDDHLLNLNFDMVGSPNYVRFVYDGDNSAFPVGPQAAEGPEGSGLIEAVFTSYFANQGLASEPTPFSGRSDYGPFIAEGIPAGGLFTGAEGIKTAAQAATYGGTAGVAYDPCYHQACDTFANNSDQGLSEMSDAAAHAVYTFGRTRAEIVNDGALKPGRNGTPSATSSRARARRGGGHEEAVAR